MYVGIGLGCENTDVVLHIKRAGIYCKLSMVVVQNKLRNSPEKIIFYTIKFGSKYNLKPMRK